MIPFSVKPTDKCLIIAPHADDESLGFGGFLLKYGASCRVVVLTDGSKCGGDEEEKIIKVRLQELATAMSYAKVAEYENLMIEDQKVRFHLDKLKNLHLQQYDYVFVPGENENHVDHACILKKVRQILRFSLKTKIICYEVWTPLSQPNLYLDITDVIKQKAELISLYESQIKNRDYTHKIISLNNYRGLICNKDYVEAYQLILPPLSRFKASFGIERNANRLQIKMFGLKINHKLKK